MILALLAAASTLAASAVPRTAPPRDAAAWAAHLGSEYDITPDVTYAVVAGVDLKLDVYAPRGSKTSRPVVVYFHGGGWAGGTRGRAVLRLMPYLEMGFTVVNATYRGSGVAPAPAAVEDCRSALRWVMENAGTHKFDTDRVVVTGDSAGSHLALMTGLQTRVAAIVNWFAATDVADLIEGPNAQPFAVAWIGNGADRAEIAKRVSPLTHVRAGVPPVLTVHGDADPVVPYRHATRLHADLARHGVRNELVTIAGGGHGGFSREDNERSFAAIRSFLAALDLLPRR